MTQRTRVSRLLLMALSAYPLLVFSTTVGQTNADTTLIGNWLGALEIGGAKLRLVFHIDITEQRALAGTVDSPDKGVKGILLSRISMNGDSVVFAVSAASASYEGTLSHDKKRIKGTWNEGGTVFPMVLERTMGTIESPTLHHDANDNVIHWDVHKASQHFDLYSSEPDRNVLDDIAKVLEENFRSVTDRLQTHFAERIRVYVYPDTRTFHAAIHVPDAPDWVVGAGGINELKMVSPMNPGTVHTYASLMQAIVHELVHAAVLNVRGERGLAGMPKWLNEGYAFYEARQMTDDMRRRVYSNALRDTPPSWATLDTASMVEFGDMDGYPLSTTIIEFLVETYGFDKLLELIRSPENLSTLYSTSRDSLEKQWVQYLKEMYHH
jgi:hypothetical protein